MAQRLRQHISESLLYRFQPMAEQKHRWVGELIDAGLRPGIRAVDFAPHNEAHDRECAWMQYYASVSGTLLNTKGCRPSHEGEKREKKDRVVYDGIGSDFRMMRERLGLSRRELSEAIGYSKVTIFVWEKRGGSIPRDAFDYVAGRYREACR